MIEERKALYQQHYDAASPEKKAEMDEHREKMKEHHEERVEKRDAEHEDFREKLKNATPAERKALIRERRVIAPEQRAAMDARRDKFNERQAERQGDVPNTAVK